MIKIKNIFFLILLISGSISCALDAPKAPDKQKSNPLPEAQKKQDQQSLIDPSATSLEGRIKPPMGYERINITSNSFAQYLRSIPLKPATSKVKYYDGRLKNAAGIYIAVVDLAIGKKDLHQCADAVMRLRAEYLWNNQQYDAIHFNFTNGFKVEYTHWMKGQRILVNGNSTKWNNTNKPSNTYHDFWKYMETIFMYAGTASLEKELLTVEIQDMKIGDVLIQGGHPGHAVIVMDMVEDKETGKKLFLLAQSYMPAQETQILVNPNDTQKSPWYTLSSDAIIKTPEWNFHHTDLKRFE